MFKNYFKVAVRNITRNKFLSSLNILGLSVGLSSALVIYLIVQYQLGFDKHYEDNDRLYRVVTHLRFAETDFKNSGVPSPLTTTVKNEVTGVEASTAVLAILYDPQVSVERAGNPKKINFKKQTKISFVDEDFFTIFERNLLAGTAKGMNTEPNLVILSESRSGLYFPGVPLSQVPGSVLYYNDTIQVRVAGVMAHNKNQTDQDHEEFISLPTIKSAGLTNRFDPGNAEEWGSVSSSNELYLKLAPGTQAAAVQKQMQALLNKYKKPEPGVDPKKNFTKFILQPLADVHFNQDYGAPADMSTLNGLMVLAGFLLLLGCINFINLSTAQAARRAKEIGIRKTIGSTRQQLIRQFLSETFLLTVVAAILAVLLTPMLLNVFKDFIPEGLSFNDSAIKKIAVFVPVLILIVSLLAGFYPALVLSKFKPVLVLKNQAYANTGQSRTAWLRKTLTVSQFIIAQFFIIATIVVGRQIQYSINMDMGFTKENIITVPVPRDFYKPDNKVFLFANELKSVPGIDMITLGDKPAISGSMSSTYKFTKEGKETEMNVQIRNADSAFIQVFGIRLIAGRNLTAADSNSAFLINETLANEMGYRNPADAVGAHFGKEKDKDQIVVAGVMKNFNLTSSKSGIMPMALRAIPRVARTIQVKLKPTLPSQGNDKKTIAAIEKKYKEIYPDTDFSYTFFDQSIKDFYTREQQLAKLLNWSTALSLFISCLGLLGLVIYTANQRQKEIGIRKVLGASITQMVNLLSKDFLKLVVIACVIAVPVAWWACSKWLENFPYRAPLNAWIFLAGASILIIIAFFILSIKTIRSAAANPVDSLRSE
ncbi:ABC transporter permease [Flavitalea sp.]|nr:ABC transporter permease [Flavitalea sp.]